MLKPQLAFDVKPDNQDITPWKPLLTTKPHAIQSLKDSLGIFTNDYDQQQYDYTDFLPLTILPPISLNSERLSKGQRLKWNHRKLLLQKRGSTIRSTNHSFRYRHPYETEILQLKYPDAVYQTADPIPYQPVETTSAVFVDTLAGVMEMLEELKAATEIAVDLEHHDQRSYVGLVSLMQISTREKDWIVDTLKPWRQDLQILNEVFADPKIIKVRSHTLILIFAHMCRSFTAHLWTLGGCKEIWASTSSVCLIHIMLAAHLDTKEVAWLFFSKSLSISMRISSTRWRTGEYGKMVKASTSVSQNSSQSSKS